MGKWVIILFEFEAIRLRTRKTDTPVCPALGRDGAGRQGHVFNGNGLLFFALRLTIKNLSYILWCIVPQVKRSSNDLPAEADLRAGWSAP